MTEKIKGGTSCETSPWGAGTGQKVRNQFGEIYTVSNCQARIATPPASYILLPLKFLDPSLCTSHSYLSIWCYFHGWFLQLNSAESQEVSDSVFYVRWGFPLPKAMRMSRVWCILLCREGSKQSYYRRGVLKVLAAWVSVGIETGWQLFLLTVESHYPRKWFQSAEILYRLLCDLINSRTVWEGYQHLCSASHAQGREWDVRLE